MLSVLKWRVAIVVQRPMAKPIRVDHWILAGHPWPKTVGFSDGFYPFLKKKLAGKIIT